MCRTHRMAFSRRTKTKLNKWPRPQCKKVNFRAFFGVEHCCRGPAPWRKCIPKNYLNSIECSVRVLCGDCTDSFSIYWVKWNCACFTSKESGFTRYQFDSVVRLFIIIIIVSPLLRPFSAWFLQINFTIYISRQIDRHIHTPYKSIHSLAPRYL